MDIAVCVKQIPSADAPVGLDPKTFLLRREGEPVLDDSDTHGIEMALRLAEASGGEVTLISMVADGASAGLRSALAMGAARAVVVSDPALSGSDALGTAKVIAAVVRRLGVGLLITATESSDGYTGTLPVQVAELLDWPALTYVTEAGTEGGTLQVRRQTDLGTDEVRCEPPAVLSVTAGAVEPRYPSLRGIMAARQKPIDQLTLADLGIEPSTVGAAGARQEVLSLAVAPLPSAGEVVIDEGEGHEAILAALTRWKVI